MADSFYLAIREDIDGPKVKKRQWNEWLTKSPLICKLSADLI
jgi:hypothetical protein